MDDLLASIKSLKYLLGGNVMDGCKSSTMEDVTTGKVSLLKSPRLNTHYKYQVCRCDRPVKGPF